jgi:hypothetical protein
MWKLNNTTLTNGWKKKREKIFKEEWKWKQNIPKLMGYSESSVQMENCICEDIKKEVEQVG